MEDLSFSVTLSNNQINIFQKINSSVNVHMDTGMFTQKINRRMDTIVHVLNIFTDMGDSSFPRIGQGLFPQNNV